MLRELGEKTTETPELVAVVGMPADDLSRVPVTPGFLRVVFDRPTSPGNVGTLVRSVDAFGGRGVIVTGHAADPYDPKAVRASTGSLFSIPGGAGGHPPTRCWTGFRSRARAACHSPSSVPMRRVRSTSPTVT